MPKIVDHEQRRRELVRAVWAVVRERGVQGASVRAVARQAGWSPSSVQYYFSTQAELLLFAMQAMGSAAGERLDAPDVPAEPRAAALTSLQRLLPLDEDSRVATELWAAFLSQVLIDPRAQAQFAADSEQLALLLRYLLDQLAAAGRLAAGADLDLETARLHALFDGIALHAVLDPARMPAARIRRLLEHHLDQLLDGRAGA